MIGFLFQVLIMLCVIGLLWYLIRWVVTSLGLPQPIIVILGVILVITFLYWCWAYFPAGGLMAPHPTRHISLQ